jgi:hypothetical protein
MALFLLLIFWGVSDPLCLSSSSALHFSDYSFWVYHPVYRDDWQLLAHAKAFDFSVTWQCLSKKTIVFVRDQTPCPYLTRSLPAQLRWHYFYYHQFVIIDVP